MNFILQNYQPDGRRPTRQLCRARTYRLQLEDLLIDGELDTSMAKWCQHRLDDGAQLILFSNHEEYARQESKRLGVESLFTW